MQSSARADLDPWKHLAGGRYQDHFVNHLGVSPGFGEAGVVLFARTIYQNLSFQQHTQEGDLNVVKGSIKGGQKRGRKSATPISKIPPPPPINCLARLSNTFPLSELLALTGCSLVFLNYTQTGFLKPV